MRFYDHSKLKKRIKEKYGSQEAFAQKLGKSRVSINNKLSEVNSFTVDDIIEWAELLEIHETEYTKYFFDRTVR